MDLNKDSKGIDCFTKFTYVQSAIARLPGFLGSNRPSMLLYVCLSRRYFDYCQFQTPGAPAPESHDASVSARTKSCRASQRLCKNASCLPTRLLALSSEDGQATLHVGLAMYLCVPCALDGSCKAVYGLFSKSSATQSHGRRSPCRPSSQFVVYSPVFPSRRK